MKAQRQMFKDVLVIEPDIIKDDRGFIFTRYSEDDFNLIKIDGIYVEEKNYIALKEKSLFGIYYQDDPYAQNKLIYCEVGSVMVYVIDLDKTSINYKKWMCIELDDSKKHQLYIPKKYGYAFITLEDDTEVVVKTDEYETDGYFRIINHLDKMIGLEFPYDEVISTYKEKQASTLRD